tara:strand:+ start:8628 stop:8966 length:339 start_codon:yes stop_codon:yes gene_type:complete
MKNIISILLLALPLCALAQPAGCGYSFTITDTDYNFGYNIVYVDDLGGREILDSQLETTWGFILPTCMGERSYIVTCFVGGEQTDRFVMERNANGTLDIRHTGSNMVAILKR